MITLDTLRPALQAEQPWSEMDRLVRAELASGRLTQQIADNLTELWDDLRKAPNFTEQEEETINDTLDRLSGFCRADQAYKNPPVLPNKYEITKLPRWARVAFAARCARRVLQLYSIYRPHQEVLPHRALRFKVQDPEWAVTEAELSAATARPRTDSKTGYLEAESGAYTTHEPGDEIAHNATNSAAYAVADAGDDTRPDRAWFAMNYALAASKPLADITASARRDFDYLTVILNTHVMTDQTPFPPEVFGPLWPDGPPAEWPSDPDAPQHTELALDILARDGLDERVLEDEIVNLFNAMNRYHIARGGQPLSLEDFQPLISALVPAGV